MTISIMTISYTTVRFIKPYLNPVYKCTGHRQDFMKWALHSMIFFVVSFKVLLGKVHYNVNSNPLKLQF